MNLKALVLILFLMFSYSVNANEQLQKILTQFNTYSEELLGLSHVSLNVLSTFEDKAKYIPRGRYDDEEFNSRYIELIGKKYIQVQFKDGIPTGQFKGQDFVWISITDKGLNLVGLLKKIDNGFNTFSNGSDDSIYDKNLDGIKDVFYEILKDGSYFELNDSNYDGKVDQSCKYDSNDNVVTCSMDQDFDGLLESKIDYYLSMPLKEGIDSNNDGIYEVVFHYESGILSKGFKFYKRKNGQAMIGKVKFKFGYPSSEVLNETKLSEKEFSNLYWREITK